MPNVKGERIRQLRKAKNLTQTELATMLDTTKQTISKYEKGVVTNIPSDRVEQLAQILDASPEYILGWDVMNTGEKNKSDSVAEITDRLFSDRSFYLVVKQLFDLVPEKFSKAKTLLDLFFKES